MTQTADGCGEVAVWNEPIEGEHQEEERNILEQQQKMTRRSYWRMALMSGMHICCCKVWNADDQICQPVFVGEQPISQDSYIGNLCIEQSQVQPEVLRQQEEESQYQQRPQW